MQQVRDRPCCQMRAKIISVLEENTYIVQQNALARDVSVGFGGDQA